MTRSAPLALTLLIASLGALPAYAQTLNLGASTDPLSVSISPDFPRPYQVITVTPSSTLLDLSASTVVISVNGKEVERGSGAQSVPVSVGGPGQATTIDVSVSAGGQTYKREVVVRPADVSLVVEPISTTHPFYEGASLVASEGRVRVIALADLRSSPTNRLNPANLTYEWKFGDKQLAEQSGIGKNVLSATAPIQYRDAQVSVTVSTADGSIVAGASTVISPMNPIVRIYPSDPLLGPLFNRALSGSFQMQGAEMSFRAVPYYFGNAPSLTWTLDSTPEGNSSDITVRANGNGTGRSTLGVAANDAAEHQTVNTSLSVLFGKVSTNIFGF